MSQAADLVRTRMQRHPLVVDAVLGALVAVLGTVALWSPPDFVDYDFRDPDALGVGLTLLGGVSVAFRRRRPVPAFAVSAVASLLPLLLGYHQTIGGLPALLTLYAVAVARPQRTSVACLVVVNLLVAAALLVGPLEPTAGDWVGNAFVLLTGWALGRSVRGRRAYTTGLEERNRALVAAQESRSRALLADERGRIAREMQDLVTHRLAAVTVQATAARRILRAEPATAEELLEAIESEGRTAMDEMRRILGVLRPDGEAAGLAPQPGLADVDDLVRAARGAGLDVTLTVRGTAVPIETGVGLTAYRIVEEALENAQQHAGRARVDVVLEWRDDALSLTVQDDGRGVTTWSSQGGRGQGLQSVRERVTAYGGRLRAGPRQGGGFGVTATLPTAGGHA